MTDPPNESGTIASPRPLVIETERLSLRGIEEEHLTAFHAAASQREVADMLASIPHPLSLDDARDWLGAREYAGVPGFVAGIFLKDGTLIGCIGLFANGLFKSLSGRFGFFFASGALGGQFINKEQTEDKDNDAEVSNVSPQRYFTGGELGHEPGSPHATDGETNTQRCDQSSHAVIIEG